MFSEDIKHHKAHTWLKLSRRYIGLPLRQINNNKRQEIAYLPKNYNQFVGLPYSISAIVHLQNKIDHEELKRVKLEVNDLFEYPPLGCPEGENLKHNVSL